MADARLDVLAGVMRRHEQALLAEWVKGQQHNHSLRNNLLRPGELEEQARDFLGELVRALASGDDTAARDRLAAIARSRAKQGFTPTETATFVFSMKQPVFDVMRKELKGDELVDAMTTATDVLDQLGLYATETYQKGREEIISRQQHELLELSTPVVQLWEGILALPLIGTLDSARTQVVMESLLQAIVETGSSIAIIDITGVPVVDTLVAQHLLKTVAAARLMGADCIISGIRPQIAQTIVHLGVDIGNVITKATLADAFAVALQRSGRTIARRAPARTEAAG